MEWSDRQSDLLRLVWAAYNNEGAYNYATVLHTALLCIDRVLAFLDTSETSGTASILLGLGVAQISMRE